MEIDCDPAKDAWNIAKRALPFRLAAVLLANLVGEFEDVRGVYGERRMVAFGMVDGRLLCCVYTLRGDTVGVISLRKASGKQQTRWLS